MGAALLQGDVGAAWTANPFVLLLLGGLGVASAFWLVEVLGGPAVRLRGPLTGQRVLYAALGLAAIAFAVLRNLAPGT